MLGMGCVGAAWGLGVGKAVCWLALPAGGGGVGSPVGVGERDTVPVPVEGTLLASTCSARCLCRHGVLTRYRSRFRFNAEGTTRGCGEKR